MAGNDSIQFLRKNNAPTSQELNQLLPGQPLYDSKNKNLYIGSMAGGADLINGSGPTGPQGLEGLGIWRSSTSTTTGTSTLAMSSISVPSGRSVKTGDLVIANDTYSYLYRVTGVVGNTISISYLTSLRGAQGSTGPAGTSKPLYSLDFCIYSTFGSQTDNILSGTMLTNATYYISGAITAPKLAEVLYDCNYRSSSTALCSIKCTSNSGRDNVVGVYSTNGYALSLLLYSDTQGSWTNLPIDWRGSRSCNLRSLL